MSDDPASVEGQKLTFDPNDLPLSPNLLAFDKTRKRKKKSGSVTLVYFCLSLSHTLLSFHFCVFLWLVANLLPPATVSISPAEVTLQAAESDAFFRASSSVTVAHNGGHHSNCLSASNWLEAVAILEATAALEAARPGAETSSVSVIAREAGVKRAGGI